MVKLERGQRGREKERERAREKSKGTPSREKRRSKAFSREQRERERAKPTGVSLAASFVDGSSMEISFTRLFITSAGKRRREKEPTRGPRKREERTAR